LVDAPEDHLVPTSLEITVTMQAGPEARDASAARGPRRCGAGRCTVSQPSRAIASCRVFQQQPWASPFV
jgi:hypothetical protein